jgi:hypothetical protein
MSCTQVAARGIFRPRAGRLAVLAGVLLMIAFPGRAGATSIRQMSLREMADGSDTIVQAKVQGVRSFWSGKKILTEVTLGVSQSLKGSSGPSLTFLQLGGTVEKPVPLTMTVPGADIFRVGEEGFFFLQPGAPGQKIIVGLSLGHILVLRDAAGDFVTFEGRRHSPSDFAEVIRQLLVELPREPAAAGPNR